MADTPIDGFVAAGWNNPGNKPTFTPAGASGGSWVFQNGVWTWRTAAKPTDPAANPNPGGTSIYTPTGVAPGPGTATSRPAYDATMDQLDTAEATAKARAAGNPFGNEMFGVQQQYTPFGLAQPSAFGAYGGGLGGFGRGGYSYGTEQLVPSLEQRRMGMLSQMYLGGR